MSSGQIRNTPANIITALPQMKWRKLFSPPYDMANVKGGWDLSEGAFPYVDGKTHDNMGRKEVAFSFRFMFLNTIQPEAFPELFTKWFDAVAVDATAGKLRHPFVGEVDARVLDWEIELTAQRTAGVIFNVNWTDSLIDPDKNKAFKTIFVYAEQAAKAADAQMAELGIDYPTGERTTSLTDMLGQINGLLFSARLTLQGMVNQAIGIVQRILDIVDNLPTHNKWSCKSNLQQLWGGLVKIGESASGKKINETKISMTPRVMSVSEIATHVDNTVGEVIGLNPIVLGAPTVPKNTPISYFV